MTLPSGTVTFVFTDIEGSTRLVAAVGDEAYGEILDTERALVVGALGAEGGVSFGSEGDAHFVAFASAAAAVRGAIAAQRALAAHAWPGDHAPVRVRMGIHTGEAQLVGDDYLGIEVHRAARIAAAGHGGQVLVSDPARVLSDGALPPGVSFRDLGEHRLKDLARPERLWQVEAPGLQAAFPTLRTLDATPNNLPPQLTSFVGRAEVAEGLHLLRRSRLLTLTGPGGTGKTRLSLVLAAEALPDHPGGAWFVPLASVTDPTLVPSSIATAAGLLSANRSPLERVIEHFRDRTALLVLDNFEQVVAAASVVAELLRAAPTLRIIASSRAPLRISGEQEFPVPPLSLPPAGAADDAQLLGSEAVRLFVERAMAVRPDFALGPDNGPAVAEIVRRLDGLPLAIELAAARIRVLSPAAMRERLTDRLGLLAAGGRDLPERQRTLRGAIEWSHDLLEPPERRLFARLGVFAGGGLLTTAEAVCANAADGTPDLDVLAGIEALAEQSLVRVAEDSHGDTRFSMLETIREYALERLDAAGERTVLAERHAAAYLALAERLSSRLHQGDRGASLDGLEEDHDNLRAALEHAIAAGDCSLASSFLAALFRFWHMRGHLVEGRSRTAAVLALTGWGDGPSRARLRAHEIAGGLAYWSGDITAASVHYANAEAEARRLGDERELANALYNRYFAGEPTGTLADWIHGLTSSSLAFLDEAIEIYRRLGDELGVARCLWAYSESKMYGGNQAEVERLTNEALPVFERNGDSFAAAWAYFTRGISRVTSANVPGAGSDLAASLRAFRGAGDVSGMSLVLSALASLLLVASRREDAQRLGGGASRLVAETGTHLASLYPAEWFPSPSPATGEPALDAAWEAGARLGRDAVVELAIRLADELAAEARPAS